MEPHVHAIPARRHGGLPCRGGQFYVDVTVKLDEGAASGRVVGAQGGAAVPVVNTWLGATGGVDAAQGADEGSQIEGYCCRSTVLACSAPSRLDFTWHFPDEPASKVGMELKESGGITALQLTHSGLGDLAESYRDGWCVHLSYLEAAALGTPLPPSMFWRLHRTVAQLNKH